MRDAERWRDAAVFGLALAAVLYGSSCGSGEQRMAEGCATGIGLGNPRCTCTSWVNYVVPGGCCCQGGGCVKLQPDLTTVPARAVVRVGDRFLVGSSHMGAPQYCNEGNWNNRPTWSSSDGSILKFESAQPASFSVAQFIALAPGVATVAVEDVLTPAGQPERVRLTACSPDEFSCSSRIPLEIVVVP